MNETKHTNHELAQEHMLHGTKHETHIEEVATLHVVDNKLIVRGFEVVRPKPAARFTPQTRVDL